MQDPDSRGGGGRRHPGPRHACLSAMQDRAESGTQLRTLPAERHLAPGGEAVWPATRGVAGRGQGGEPHLRTAVVHDRRGRRRHEATLQGQVIGLDLDRVTTHRRWQRRNERAHDAIAVGLGATRLRPRPLDGGVAPIEVHGGARTEPAPANPDVAGHRKPARGVGEVGTTHSEVRDASHLQAGRERRRGGRCGGGGQAQ